MNETWQFWIDVGGTFTDCIARRPDGQLLRHKALSSAITKGSVGFGSDRLQIVDVARGNDPDGFWNGCRFCLVANDGSVTSESVVKRFDRHRCILILESPLDVAPHSGQSFELHSADDAPLLAIRYLMEITPDQDIPPVSVRLGTTRGTNALITRRGARTALVVTRGFGDILRIGYQNRPRLFDLAIRKPESIVSDVLEVDERIAADGTVVTEPDASAARAGLKLLHESGVESLAVCLLHAYRNPRHEELIAQIAREVGFDEISVSSRVAPLIKIVARGDTTTLDAYLNPVLRGYVRRLRRALGARDRTDLRMLTSAGGLIDADRFLGKDSILSGPAGGVVGFSRIAAAAGFDRAIGFDMGGTSTDVTRFDGDFELQYETEKTGIRVVSPMMAIETVAAGGGSICCFDGVKLTVGPDSAGADPGPACYGRGGPLTVTDLNFFLGKILTEEFPFALDRNAVESKLAALADVIATATRQQYGLYELARGLLRVANANMTKAIRCISVAKGYDPRDYLLVSFGGAAPQHACAIAQELGIRRILNHRDAGILSAYGIGMADVVRHRATGIYQTLDHATLSQVEQTLARLAVDACEDVKAEGVSADCIKIVHHLDLRYQGVDSYLTIPRPADGDFEAAFTRAHQQRYGYEHCGRPLEIVAARVQATGQSEIQPAATQRMPRRTVSATRHSEIHFRDTPLHASVFARADLQPGDWFSGPAIITEQLSTTIVDPGWMAEVLSGGEILIQPCDSGSTTEAPAKIPSKCEAPNPVDLELFNNQFAGIAEQMGITLRNTSSSVNVKERLDFSCALFTSDGDLVVNAPHIPVHLGAMSETVKCLIEDNPTICSGDVYVTNDPYRGGSHLPDITVITPVHSDHGDDEGRLLFFTASRAHHAEIGGIAPGSMPPFSKSLAEEGVLIRNFKLVDRQSSRHGALRALLESPPYPSRAVDENLADIAAQVAANRRGARDLLQLIARHGADLVQAYMRHIQAAAEQKMRAALSRLPDGDHRFVDYLDNGAPIAVTISVRDDCAEIDFQGTGAVLVGNLNANRAIVTAAVMYVFRCLIDEDIPLNQGVLAPLKILLPQCLLNPPLHQDPRRSAAVAGGNVETSQRIVDVLFGALGKTAASQGTMNNVLFGDASFGYYETICGGSGATPDQAGADAVHTHMTNTRLTDPEVLELRYPVRVRQFSIRRGSGGLGRRRGGNGVIRQLEFLQPLQVSLLTQRRGDYAPYGIRGGRPGAIGRNVLTRADGRVEQRQALDQFQVGLGDVLTIETPGGGGAGRVED